MQIAQAIAAMAGAKPRHAGGIKNALWHPCATASSAPSTLADNVSIGGLIDAVFNAVPVP